MTTWNAMTVAGIALIAGGLAILVVFRRLLWGTGEPRGGAGGGSLPAAVPTPRRARPARSRRDREASGHTPAAELFPEGFFSEKGAPETSGPDNAMAQDAADDGGRPDRDVTPRRREGGSGPVGPAPAGVVTLGLADDEGGLGPAPMGELFDHIELPPSGPASDSAGPAPAEMDDPAGYDTTSPDPTSPDPTVDDQAGQDPAGQDPAVHAEAAHDRVEDDRGAAGSNEPEHTVKLIGFSSTGVPLEGTHPVGVDPVAARPAGYRYGDRVDGWVRPDYGNHLTESTPVSAGEYWLPVSDPYADAAYGWVTAARGQERTGTAPHDGPSARSTGGSSRAVRSRDAVPPPDAASRRGWAPAGDVAPVVEPMPAPAFDAAEIFAAARLPAAGGRDRSTVQRRSSDPLRGDQATIAGYDHPTSWPDAGPLLATAPAVVAFDAVPVNAMAPAPAWPPPAYPIDVPASPPRRVPADPIPPAPIPPGPVRQGPVERGPAGTGPARSPEEFRGERPADAFETVLPAPGLPAAASLPDGDAERVGRQFSRRRRAAARRNQGRIDAPPQGEQLAHTGVTHPRDERRRRPASADADPPAADATQTLPPVPVVEGYGTREPERADPRRREPEPATRPRPRPRPRPNNASPAEDRQPARSTVYVSRHAAEPS